MAKSISWSFVWQGSLYDLGPRQSVQIELPQAAVNIRASKDNNNRRVEKPNVVTGAGNFDVIGARYDRVQLGPVARLQIKNPRLTGAEGEAPNQIKSKQSKSTKAFIT